MAHTLTIEQLKAEYKKAYNEGKELLKVQIGEKEYTLNAIATIKLNAINAIRAHIKTQIGTLIIEEDNDQS